jgi:uncharacterized protein YndB with AHSA1/START domain
VAAGKTNRPGVDPTAVAGREIVITRLFDAPREMVWDAWTDPEQVVKWWGPHGFTLTIDEMDVRLGGVWKSTMHGPDGAQYINDCVFTEVVRPQRIAYKLTAGSKQGRGVQEPMEASWTFQAQGEMTMITLRMVFQTPEALERFVREYKAVEGGNETLDRLARHLAKESEGTQKLT